jgi:FkbM family methyltransferase
VRHEYVLKAIPQLLDLVREDGAAIAIDPQLGFEVQICGVKLLPATAQEIIIVHEVFHDEVYSLEYRQPMYVWDIGANVGTTALYFAAVSGWEVSAYELFPATAAAARTNIDRSGLDAKVTLADVGLGKSDRRMSLPYNAGSRGSNGFFGNTALDKQGVDQMIDVSVRDAAEVFEEVYRRAAGRPILAKLDCEGAEFEIIPRLKESGALAKITTIALEVHALPETDPDALVADLLEVGYVVRRRRKLRKDVDMIYATRAVE